MIVLRVAGRMPRQADLAARWSITTAAARGELPAEEVAN